MSRRFWLMKTEPESFGFADLIARPQMTEPWDGVRNYQARNSIRDDMQVGDGVLIYHSRVDPPHVAGEAVIASPARPDPSQFDPASKYYDAKAAPEAPRWFLVDVRGLRWLDRPVSLPELKANPALTAMAVVQKGQRLSIQPVTESHYEEVLAMSRRASLGGA
jgi:predicted RNA-binding protein with PUA-like domain